MGTRLSGTQYNEVPRDCENVFILTVARYIRVLYILLLLGLVLRI